MDIRAILPRARRADAARQPGGARRIPDGRVSGASYGACIPHVAPESHAGGPLALVRTGDTIEGDVASHRIHLHVPEEEGNARRAAWTPPPPRYERGYGWT